MATVIEFAPAVSPFTGLNTPTQQVYAAPSGWAAAGWAAARVAMTEDGAQPGRYYATVDESASSSWLIYVSTSTPAYYTYVASATIPQTIAGTGTGARAVTITVRAPDTSLVQGATVRLTRAGETLVGITNASGVIAFSTGDYTWTVSITAAGFAFTPVSLVVTANVSQPYTLTAAGGGVTPSTTPLTTGYWIVYDLNGSPQVGTQVTLSAAAPPVGSTGIVMEDAPRTATTDSDGIVQFSNLVKGATYVVNRTGSTRKFNVLVPTSAGASVALGSIVG